ncbi:MAG TPA: DUF3787 domain-containing protein [Ruminiclostridium sp.]|nr:DUF3787 domain-containing protein [Ruminiclostridium sp.]
MNKKDAQLDGRDNRRQTAFRPTDNEGTAAWTNEGTRQEHTDVVIPKDEGVLEAKKWVDNGSKL